MVKPPLRTKSIGFKVSEEEYAQLETAAQRSGQTLGEWCREAAVLTGTNGEPPQAATGPGGAGVQAGFANAIMAEVVALRAILLNVAAVAVLRPAVASLLPGPGWVYTGAAIVYDLGIVGKSYVECRNGGGQPVVETPAGFLADGQLPRLTSLPQFLRHKLSYLGRCQVAFAMTGYDKNSPFKSDWPPPAWMSFLFHAAFGTIGAMLIAGIASVLLSTIVMHNSVVGFLTLGPSFLLPLLSGVTLGYMLGRTYYTRAATWSWVLPTGVLALVLTSSLVYAPSQSETWSNLFGPESRCTSICLGQLFFSGPFFSSLTYTIGLKLRQRRGRS
jgi:hypothetical protein